MRLSGCAGPRNLDGSLPRCWLRAEWSDGAAEPSDYWLLTQDEGTPIEELFRWAKIHRPHRT